MDYNGPERRKGGIGTEHRLTTLETHLPILYAQVKDVKAEVRIEGDATRLAIEEYTKDTNARINRLEHWRDALAGAYTAACVFVGWFFSKE